MSNEKYETYLKERREIGVDKTKPFNVEKDGIHIIDTYKPESEFVIVYKNGANFFIYRCRRHGKRLHIYGMEEIEGPSISNLPEFEVPVYSCNLYSSNFTSFTSPAYVDVRNRAYCPNDKMKKRVGIFSCDYDLASIKDISVSVPLDNETLDSVFWEDFTWRDILPNTDCDITIAGIELKRVSFSVVWDCFQNIFLKTTDMQGYDNTTLLHNAFGVNISSLDDPNLSGLKKDSTYNNCYVIDTNVFLNYPDILNCFDNTDRVIVPAMVSGELDKHKMSNDKNISIKAARALKSIVEHKNAIDLVRLKDEKYIPLELKQFKHTDPDGLIISVAIQLQDPKVKLITSDNGMIVRANSYDIQTITPDEFLNDIKY